MPKISGSYDASGSYNFRAYNARPCSSRRYGSGSHDAISESRRATGLHNARREEFTRTSLLPPAQLPRYSSPSLDSAGAAILDATLNKKPPVSALSFNPAPLTPKGALIKAFADLLFPLALLSSIRSAGANEDYNLAPNYMGSKRHHITPTSVFDEVGQKLSRRKRSVQIAPSEAQVGLSHDINDDYSKLHPLNKTRADAVRIHMGPEAEDLTPSERLKEANKLYRNAYNNPDNKDAHRKARNLLKIEAKNWVHENGGDKVLPEKDYIRVYLEDRMLAHQPIRQQQFKTEKQILEEFKSNPNGLHLARHGEHLARKMVAYQYNTQFEEYITKHLPLLCDATAIQSASNTGIPRIILETKPNQIWEVNGIHQQVLTSYFGPSWLVDVDRTEGLAMPAYIMPLPEGKFVFIDLEGRLHKLDRNPAEDCNTPMLVDLLKIYASGDAIRPSIRFVSNNTATIKQKASEKCREHLKTEISGWQKGNSLAAQEERVKEGFELAANAALIVASIAQPELLVEEIPMFLLEREGTEAAGIALGETVEEEGLQLAEDLEKGALGRQTKDLETRVGNDEANNIEEARDEAPERASDETCPPGCFPAGIVKRAAPETESAPARADREKRGIANCFCPTLNEEEVLPNIYEQLSRETGRTSETIEEIINADAENRPERYVYRGQPAPAEGVQPRIAEQFGLIEPSRQDDYLVTLFKHTATQGGEYHVSLSLKPRVAGNFAGREGIPVVLRIDTKFDPENFRTTADLIKNEGPRLVAQGKLKKDILKKAIKELLHTHAGFEPEQEIFYIKGEIPPQHITISGKPS